MYAQSHIWASASRPMPPESAFRHLVSQSGTGAFLKRNKMALLGILGGSWHSELEFLKSLWGLGTEEE
jgi:hypothetical protein